MATSAPQALAQNAVSPPVGFVRVELSSNSQSLASFPFHALQEGTPAGSVGMLAWDAVAGYMAVTQASPTVGQGIWLVNNAATQAVVFLAGEVPLDAEAAVPLAPGLNLIGHSYPTPVGVDATGLDPASLTAADGAPVSTLRPGEGYWYQHAGDQPVVWVEARPYVNPFPTNGLPPEIVGLEVIDDGQAVRLTVVPSSESAPLDLYYQDLIADQPFDPLNGWLSAGYAAPGGSESVWEDRGSPTRPTPAAVFGRLYLAAQGDLAEALENSGQVPGQSAIGGAGDGAGSIGVEPEELFSGEALASEQGLHGSTTNTLPAARLLALEKIIYVDARRGQDRYSGRAPVVVDAALGPKQTLHGGLAAARPGDTLIVRSGHYREHVNLSGRDLKVRIAGSVNLSGSPYPAAAPVPLPTPQPMTNTLAAVDGELAGE